MQYSFKVKAEALFFTRRDTAKGSASFTSTCPDGRQHWICLKSCPGYYSRCCPSNSRTSYIILLTDVLTNMGQVNSFDHCRDKIDLFWCSTVTRECIWNINPEYDKGSDHWCPDYAADCALSQEHIKKKPVFHSLPAQNKTRPSILVDGQWDSLLFITSLNQCHLRESSLQEYGTNALHTQELSKWERTIKWKIGAHNFSADR